MPRILTVNPEPLRVINCGFISIAGHVPHDNLITGFNSLTLKRHIVLCDATHMGQRRLPTNNFGNHRGNQARIGTELLILERILIQPQHATRNRISGCVVPPNNQQN